MTIKTITYDFYWDRVMIVGETRHIPQEYELKPYNNSNYNKVINTVEWCSLYFSRNTFDLPTPFVMFIDEYKNNKDKLNQIPILFDWDTHLTPIVFESILTSKTLNKATNIECSYQDTSKEMA